MKMMDKPGEECAVFGVSSKTEEAADLIYSGLMALQHRGQEGCGIAVSFGNRILYQKDTGLVQEVFTEEVFARLPKSKAGIGHNRYSTTGTNCSANVGPFISEYLTGRIATAHNGNLTNAAQLKKRLEQEGVGFLATSDSEVVSAMIAYYICKEGGLKEGIQKAAEQFEGAFSLVIMAGDGTVIAVRDASGYRPLCLGTKEGAIAAASESCAFDSCGFQLLRDVEPGEMVILEDGEIQEAELILPLKQNNSGLCIFEYVYFARPDSVLDGLSVYKARCKMGQMLAMEHPVDADIVVGVPDSGLDAALGYSEISQIPAVNGFVKNRYIGRSFIYPTQTQRERAVRLKLNPLVPVVKGKRVVLIDDSIVRGTTCEKIVGSLREAGATEIHVRISSPLFQHSCHYGTDIDKEEHLIANQMTVEEIRKEIKADSLGFISVEGLKKACGGCALPFCTHCFTGDNGSEDCRKDSLELENK